MNSVGNNDEAQEEFDKLLAFISSKNLKDEKNYSDLCDKVDIISFADYYATKLYIGDASSFLVAM